jgi:hypothetical protein
LPVLGLVGSDAAAALSQLRGLRGEW